MNTTPHVTETESELTQAERDCEAFAALFNRRHRTPKKKRSSRKPEFVIRTQPVGDGTTLCDYSGTPSNVNAMQVLNIDPGFRALLPVSSSEQLSLLESDLRRHGCRDPLVVWKSEEADDPILLDGHNRYEICTRLNLPFKAVALQGCATREEVLLWIVANQLARRNLTPSQKAAVSLELEKQLAVEAKKRMALGGKEKGKAIVPDLQKGQTRDKAAETFGASPRYVSDAKQIERDAPELLAEVIQGRLNIPQAKKVAALPAEDRPAAIARVHNKEPVAEGGYIYRDGKLVAVQTNKEVGVWLRRTSQVLHAIEALATIDVSPEEYLREFQPSYAEQINAQLPAATHWLKHFVKCWEERHEKAT